MLQTIQLSKLRQFCLKQIRDLKVGGWSVFFRKAGMFLKQLLFLIGIIVVAPLVCLIVALRSIVLVRFGTMRSNRIGHFSTDVEAYLCASDHELKSHRKFDIICCPEPACNHQLQKMWARTLKITPGVGWWTLLDRACMFWTRGNMHHIQLYSRSKDYKYFSIPNTHLCFTDEEHLQGQAILKEFGIPSGGLWVCIHSRDSAYLDKSLGGDYAYHNYRDFNIQSLLMASEELSRRGYYVLRMGAIVAEPLISNNTKIVDYATSSLRSDFADMYLLAGCSAYIGSDAGIAGIPLIFRKPVSYINFSTTLISLIIDQGCYSFPFIMKHLWHKEKQRFLSLREMFEIGLAGASETYLFEQAGIEPVCNTPEDIRELAIEVDERLKGTWQPQFEDDELQKQFWDIFRQYTPNDTMGDVKGRIGAAFLRKHKYLLG